MNNKNVMMGVLGGLVLVIVGGGAYYLGTLNQPQTVTTAPNPSQVTITPAPTPTPNPQGIAVGEPAPGTTPPLSSAGTKQYVFQGGYTIQYPSQYDLSALTGVSGVVLKSQKNVLSVQFWDSSAATTPKVTTFDKAVNYIAEHGVQYGISCGSTGSVGNVTCDPKKAILKKFVNKNGVAGYEVYIDQETEVASASRTTTTTKLLGPVLIMDISGEYNDSLVHTVVISPDEASALLYTTTYLQSQVDFKNDLYVIADSIK